MKTLNFYHTSEIDDLAWPEDPQNLTVESSAMAFFTDFNETKPLVIESTVSGVEVKKIMQKAHVRMKFVINELGHFIGIISLDDLLDTNIIKKLSEGFNREDLLVTDLMTPKRTLLALDYHEVATSTINDVISVLQDSGKQHCLVVDRVAHKIRGVFSASDISRKLHLPIDIQDKSNFYKVFSAAG